MKLPKIRDMGFEQAGFDVVWTNEVNPVFAKMYAYGMSGWRKSLVKDATPTAVTNTKDIQRLFAPEILAQAFPSETAPPFFGTIGGPPCSDFCSGGKNLGGEGVNGRLTKIYVDRICSIMPAFFVLENVPGLYRTHRHRKFLKKLEKKLASKGYCLDLKILSALEMGVPQDRERLIIVGIKESFASLSAGRKIEKDERDWFLWPSASWQK